MRARTVRRGGLPDYGGGWTPHSMANQQAGGVSDLVCWYNAEAAEGRAGDVSAVPDLGQWGFALDNSYGNASPLVTIDRPAALGYRPAFYFGGGGRVLGHVPSSGRGPTGAYKTMFAVAVASVNAWLWGKGNADASDEFSMGLLSTPYYDSDGGGGWVQVGGHTLGTAYVWTGRNDSGGVHQIWRNLASQGTRTSAGSGSTATTSGVFVGGARSGTQQFNGWIADAFAYRRALTNDEVTFVIRKLGAYYGIAV